MDELTSTTGIEELLQEVNYASLAVSNYLSPVQSLVLLDIASTKAEAFVSSPDAIHEFIVSYCVKEDCWDQLTCTV